MFYKLYMRNINKYDVSTNNFQNKLSISIWVY